MSGQVKYRMLNVEGKKKTSVLNIPCSTFCIPAGVYPASRIVVQDRLDAGPE